MANDVKAMCTINNATIFIVATCVAVVSVDPCCISDVSFYRHKRQEHGHVKGSVVQTWTQQPTVVDQFFCRTCFFPCLSCDSVTDTVHSSSANVFLSWFLVVTVFTSFGRDCGLHKRQDLFDDLKIILECAK